MNYILFAIGILMGSLGGILLKIGSSHLGEFHFTFKYIVYNILLNKFVILGLLMYFIPALIWVYLLKFYHISYLQPILALTYVLTPILAIFILKEPVSAIRWIGIAVIIVGVFIVSKS